MASTQRDEISRLELLHAAHPDGLVFPHLADAYRRAGRYAQAEGVLTAGLQRHSDYSSAHVVLGRLRLDQGQYAEAEEAFHRVLELDPQNHVALSYLGGLMEEQGRVREALPLLRRLSRLKPAPELEERVARLEARLARLEKAGRGGNGVRFESDDPGRVPRSGTAARGVREPGEVVTETMAELYSRQGLHGRAIRVYRQLLERRPDDRRLAEKLRRAEAGLTGGPPAPRARPEPADAPYPWEPPASTIREGLGQLLAWRPDTARAADESPPPPQRRASEESPPSSGRPAAAGRASAGPVASVRVPASADAPASQGRWRPPVGRLSPSGAAAVETASGVAATAQSLIAITDMLVGLLEYRDPFFRGSSSLTRLMAENVAEELGLPPEQRVDLALAAVLRDLGRLAMGGRLVSATGAPTPEVRRRIERHVDLALHLLEGIELPRPVRLAVRHHHERWDGAGYPDGLSGRKIPELARVLAVVDSFAAMVSPRSYRLPRKVREAARELQQAAGSQYDPAVVDALMRVLEKRDQGHLNTFQRPHILLLDPDEPGAVVTAAKLCMAGYLAEVSSEPGAARDRLRRVPVSALVISAETGAERAVGLVRDLRVEPMFASLPIVVVNADSVDLRVRLLESGADVCFPPETTHAELQGTLGALVRRSIRGEPAGDGDGPRGAPWLALQGDLEDFPLTWLLQVMKYDSRTAEVGIRTADEQEGVIYLEQGDAIHARIRHGSEGEEALRTMLGWEQGRFRVKPDAHARRRTIETSIMHLLLTQAVDRDHAAAGIFGAVSDES